MTDENARAAAENAAIDAELASLQTMVRSGVGLEPAADFMSDPGINKLLEKRAAAELMQKAPAQARSIFADSDPGDEARAAHHTQPYDRAYPRRLYDPYAGLRGADSARDELLRMRLELAALRHETAETASSMRNLSSLLSCILGARASAARPEDQIAVLQDLAAFVGLDMSRVTIKVQR